MQLVAKAPWLLQGSGDQRLEGGAKLGGEFGFGVKLGNHNQGMASEPLVKTGVSMPAPDWGYRAAVAKHY